MQSVELFWIYAPEKVSKITWIPEELIIQAARLYASSKYAIICAGNALDSNEDSFHKVRITSILMDLTDNIDIPGGQIEKASV